MNQIPQENNFKSNEVNPNININNLGMDQFKKEFEKISLKNNFNNFDNSNFAFKQGQQPTENTGKNIQQPNIPTQNVNVPNKNNFSIDTQHYEYKSNTQTVKPDTEQVKGGQYPGQFMGYPYYNEM